MDIESALRRATDPTTPADALDAVWATVSRFAWSDRERIVAALVRNPNLGLERFRQLSGNQPLAALENPAFELYALEDPGWFARVSNLAATAMVLAPAGRQRVVDLAALHPMPQPRRFAHSLGWLVSSRLDRALASSPWRTWPRVVTDMVRGELQRSPRLRGLAVEILDSGQMLEAAPLHRPWVDAALESHDPTHLTAELAWREALTLARQRRLADSPSATVRWRLAGNRQLASEIAERLARSELATVRTALARNPATPSPVLRQLLADPAEEVARTAAAQLASRSPDTHGQGDRPTDPPRPGATLAG